VSEEVAVIPIEQIIDPKFLLRFVDKRTVEYLEMLDSIGKTGLWNSIAVRPAGDRAPGKFEVIDGFYRLTCCRELGRETVPCIIRQGVTDEQVLAAQIRANAVRPETTTIEFAKQLKRIQDLRPGITLPEIAAMVNKNPQWVSKQLNLLNLPTQVQHWVDRGEIPMQSAYMLAKVPPRVCMEMAIQARVMDTTTFQAWAASVIKSFMESVRQGKLDARFNDLEFTPQPHLRPLKEVVKEIEAKEHAPIVVTTENAKTALEGFIAALKWVANMDREGVREQRQRYEAIRRKPDLLALYREREDESDEP
jgi:ParB/RepB/Spo0J family partition protein